MNSKACLYIWGLHQILLLAAYIIRTLKLVSAVTTEEGIITYTRLYYNTRRIFTILASSLIAYMVIIKWVGGWRIDNWWIEAVLVLATMTTGHITFIAALNTDQFNDAYTKLKKPYRVFALLFIASFYIRLVLAALSMFSYNPTAADKMLPDIRYKDLYLFKNYYLSYSEPKGIVVTKKVFIFSKDITTLRTFTLSLCDFRAHDFTDDNDKSIPFPFSQRRASDVVVLTNPTQKKGYLDFTIDSLQRLKITGRIYATTNAKIDATYMLCGTIYVK